MFFIILFQKTTANRVSVGCCVIYPRRTYYTRITASDLRFRKPDAVETVARIFLDAINHRMSDLPGECDAHRPVSQQC